RSSPPGRHATSHPASGLWRPLYRKYPVPGDDTPAAPSACAAEAVASQRYPARRAHPGGLRCLCYQKDTPMTDTQRLKDTLTNLRLKGMLQQLDPTLEQAAQKNLNVVATLALLADLELEHRWHNAIHLRWRQSALTEKLTIDQFDFDHHKSRKEQKTRILAL